LGSESFLHFLSGALSSGWIRNDINITAQGSNSEIFAHGIGFSRGAGVVDQQTSLIFAEPNNKAEQVCKNLLMDSSRTIFNGRIHIQPKAQKTDSAQLHQSLLLSTEAEVDTKPELEIYADDVKATHGATIGQLSADEVFYFQSRGIKRERAQALLSQAFLLDLCERLANRDVQAFLKDRIAAYWQKEAL
jgi:Fe-S cluster assembly protein SufD